MKKFLLFCVLLTSCAGPKYIEKQSEILSQTVYATNSSLKVGRIDLAQKYSDQEIRLINPPKTRIFIEPIKNKIILPADLKNNQTIFVDSAEYNELLSNKELAARLQQENASMENQVEAVNLQITKNAEVQSKLLNDYNQEILRTAGLEKSIVAKNYSLFVHKIIIFFLLTGFGLCVFLRIKGIL